MDVKEAVQAARACFASARSTRWSPALCSLRERQRAIDATTAGYHARRTGKE